MVPNISAGNGTKPGEASTMPTTAVNTISRVTLGLVSSRKSRHRPKPGRVMGGLSGRVGTMQGYHADCGRRPKGAQQTHHAHHQKSGACVMQSREGQGYAEMHGRHADANLQCNSGHQQEPRPPQAVARGGSGARGCGQPQGQQKPDRDPGTQAVGEKNG